MKLQINHITIILPALVLMALAASRTPAQATTSVSACGALASPGGYAVTTNLTATGDCLVLGAKNIAIDLQGHTITGNGTGSAITDGGANRSEAIVANGKLRNFSVGINLTGSGEIAITNVDSSNNTSTGVLIGDCCDTLINVTANSNGGDGIEIDSDDSSLTNIQANGNGVLGVDISECCNTLVSSTVTNNTSGGVFMGSCCNFVVSSKVQNNGGPGVALESDDNGVVKSTVSGNSGDGLDFTTSGDNMITSSTISGNGGTGILLKPGKFGVISVSKVTKNGGNGVDMNCRGSIGGLTSTGNGGANLVTTNVDGPCATLNVKAP